MDINAILSGAQDILTARRVFGEPIQVGDATIIPVARVRGGGGGGKRSEEAGVGFGVDAKATGVYVVRNGTAAWRPAVNINRIVLGGQIVGIVALLTLGPVVKTWLEGRKRGGPTQTG